MTPDATIATAIPGFTLRFAGPDDVPLVMRFIRDLAEYEKLLDEMVATEERLHAALFGEEAVAECIIGAFEEEPVGFALFFHNFSTFLSRRGLYLEDLFVVPAMRGRGFGRAMLSYLAHLAVERGCGRFEWWVLDWNEPAIQFYQSLGAEAMDEWTTYRLTGHALRALATEFDKDA